MGKRGLCVAERWASDLDRPSQLIGRQPTSANIARRIGSERVRDYAYQPRKLLAKLGLFKK
jgi:hypothetical protein